MAPKRPLLTNVTPSVRRFVLDLTNAPADNYVCGIHTDVDGEDTTMSSLRVQDIDVYMAARSTQYGLFLEGEGSGEVILEEEYIQGGQVGVLQTTLQCTAHNIIFADCQTPLLVRTESGQHEDGVPFPKVTQLSKTPFTTTRERPAWSLRAEIISIRAAQTCKHSIYTAA